MGRLRGDARGVPRSGARRGDGFRVRRRIPHARARRRDAPEPDPRRADRPAARRRRDGMTVQEPMPSRAFAERYENLFAIGGHPAVDMPPHVVEAAARAAERPAYAPTLGAPTLREAIAELHETSADCVLVTVGGMQALYLVAQVYGARAVSHAPALFFPQVVEAAGGTCGVAYGWDEYAAAIGADTTPAIGHTPVNPTGSRFR